MASAGAATIVVVESDAAAQELMDQALRGAGHRVLVTRDPQEALRLGERVRIDVLVGDVELCRRPVALVVRLLSLQPEMRLVLVADPHEQHLSEVDRAVSLRRPISLDELERAIAHALASDRR